MKRKSRMVRVDDEFAEVLKEVTEEHNKVLGEGLNLFSQVDASRWFASEWKEKKRRKNG